MGIVTRAVKKNGQFRSIGQHRLPPKTFGRPLDENWKKAITESSDASGCHEAKAARKFEWVPLNRRFPLSDHCSALRPLNITARAIAPQEGQSCRY